MVEMSENKEALVVLTGSIMAALTGYLAAVGYTLEAGLIGTVATAILAFWKAKVNTESS